MYLKIILDGDDDIAINIGHGLKPESYFVVRVNGQDEDEIFGKAAAFMQGITARAYYDSKEHAADSFINEFKPKMIKALTQYKDRFAMGGNQSIEYRLLPPKETYDLVL